LFLLFTISNSICAQNFETAWLGNYAGILKLYNAKIDSVNVRLTLSRIDDLRTRYIMSGKHKEYQRTKKQNINLKKIKINRLNRG